MIPPKPRLTVDIVEFRMMESIKYDLDRQVKAIYQVEESELPELRMMLGELKGIFKGKERKAMEQKIQSTEERLSNMKIHLQRIVNRYDYDNVKSFMEVYNKSEDEISKYQKAMDDWIQKNGKIQPEQENISEMLKQFDEEVKSRNQSRQH